MASPQRGLVPLHFGAALQQSSALAMQDAHNLFEQAIHLVNVLVIVTGKTTNTSMNRPFSLLFVMSLKL